MSAEMVISEILYDAAPTNDGGEFIELVNIGDASIDVSGWVLTDAVSYTFPAGTTVQPGDRLVVARRAAAAADFYGIDVVGQYVGRLGNGGETIVLADNSLPRRVQDVVSYEDEIPWPTEADGGGPSLEFDLQSPDNSDAASWFIGQPYSPGAPNSLGATNGGDVAITEILYKPLREEYRETFDRVSGGSYMERDTDDFGEYVEITNRGSSPIDLGGWRFTSGIEYTFEETTLDPGAILIVAADPEMTRERFGIENVVGPFQGSLSDGGERITLTDEMGALIDTVAYDDRHPFPVAADEYGYSIEVIDIHEDNGTAANWRSSVSKLPEAIVVLNDSIDSAEGWEFVQITGEASSNRLYLFVEGPGEWLVDDVRMVAVGDGENLIENGDFEVDDEGWRKNGNHAESFRTQEDSHGGVACEHIVSSGVGQNLSDCLMIRRVEGVVRNQRYTLSFHAKHLSGNNTLTARLSGEGLVVSAIAGMEDTSLTEEWSDDSNPNGLWIYADIEGNALTEATESWLPDDLGENQRAWTAGGQTGTPGWCRSMGGATAGAFPEGQIGTLGPSRLVWTPPYSGQVTIRGGLYLLKQVAHDQVWKISLNDEKLTEGLLIADSLNVNSGDPMPFSAGNGKDDALTFIVFEGDEIRFDLQAAEEGQEGLVVVDLDIEFRRGNLAVPPLAGVVGRGSPGRVNSVEAAGFPPLVRDLNHLVEVPSSRQRVPVRARVTSSSPLKKVELEYSIDRSTSTTVIEMRDDGQSGDGEEDDSIYGATLPTQESKTLVHYRVRAVDDEGRETAFPYDDEPSPTQAYYHYDGEVNTQLTFYDLFLTSENLAKLLRSPRSDDYVDASLVVNGVAYPHIGVRKRGRGTRVAPKHQWKFRFNRNDLFRGHGFNDGIVDGNGDRVVDLMLNQPYGQEMTFRIMDLSESENFEHDLVRVHLNNKFFGVYVAFESPNSSWLRKHGFDAQDEIYKPRSSETPNRTLNADYYHNDIDTDFEYWGVWNKKVRSLERPTEIRELVDALNDLSVEELLDWSARRIDVDQWFTRWSQYILMNVDDFTTNNHFLHLEGAGSESGGRWKWYAYDFDSGFTYNRVGALRVLYGDGKLGANPDWQMGRWQRIVSDNSTLRRIYFLILRDMLDEIYRAETIFPMMDDLFAIAAPDRLLDNARWSAMRPSTSEMKTVFDGQRQRTDDFLARQSLPGHGDTPTASPPGGVFEAPVEVVLPGVDGHELYYTVDDTDPRLSLGRTLYEGGLVIAESTTLTVAAIDGALSSGDWTRKRRYDFEITGVGVGPFVRGDCNGDGIAAGDTSDALRLVIFNFSGGEPPPCKAACDANGDGDTSGVSDAVWMLVHSFLSGAPPVPPFPDCGNSTLAEDTRLECDAPACP